jgi:hypothetical protein
VADSVTEVAPGERRISVAPRALEAE